MFQCPVKPAAAATSELAARALGIIGGHLFYLQFLGKTLTEHRRAPDNETLKVALRNLLFSSSG